MIRLLIRPSGMPTWLRLGSTRAPPRSSPMTPPSSISRPFGGLISRTLYSSGLRPHTTISPAAAVLRQSSGVARSDGAGGFSSNSLGSILIGSAAAEAKRRIEASCRIVLLR